MSDNSPDLSQFSAAALVDAIIRLTHIIHTTNLPLRADASLPRDERLRRVGVVREERLRKIDDYRASRDLARAELIRRCAGEQPLRLMKGNDHV